MEVCKEKNYIARNCKRNKFARIVAAVCPKAGDAKKIDQNMQKYREIDPKKSNDFASIRARFKAPGKKYRSLDHNSLFLRTSSYAC